MQPSSQHSLIVLIGFMGAGKTTVGRELARRLKWRFLDLDDCITEREGRAIPDIFASEGESGFRRIEAECLRELLDRRDTPLIVALGGGAWVQPANATALKQAGAQVIFLDARIEELRARCAEKAGTRPLFQDENQFRKLYESRRSSYMQADLRVDTGGRRAAAIARELALRLQTDVTDASR